MAQRDHYRVLGVARSASPGEIHAAYRELAKLRHPDRGGSTTEFQEVARAYDVLSDPALRRAYDAELGVTRLRPRVAPPEAEPLTSPREAEPMHGPLREPIAIFADAGTRWPSLDALLERWWRNFGHGEVPKAERAEPLGVEVVLSPEEAAAGGVLPLVVPVEGPCPRCRGAGHEWLFPCPACEGSGHVESESLVRIPIPPGTMAPTTIERSLADLGIDNFYLRVHVRVAP